MKYQNIAVPMENLSRETTFPSQMNIFYYPLKLFVNARSKSMVCFRFLLKLQHALSAAYPFIFMTHHTWYIYQPSLLSLLQTVCYIKKMKENYLYSAKNNFNDVIYFYARLNRMITCKATSNVYIRKYSISKRNLSKLPTWWHNTNQ